MARKPQKGTAASARRGLKLAADGRKSRKARGETVGQNNAGKAAMNRESMKLSGLKFGKETRARYGTARGVASQG